MKPGSLVMFDFEDPMMFGVIIRVSEWTNLWGKPWDKTTSGDNDKYYRWWEILCGDNIVVKPETLLKLVE